MAVGFRWVWGGSWMNEASQLVDQSVGRSVRPGAHDVGGRWHTIIGCGWLSRHPSLSPMPPLPPNPPRTPQQTSTSTIPPNPPD